MATASERELTREIQRRAGLDQAEQAQRVLRATLETLGQLLTVPEARALAAHLPPGPRAWLVGAPQRSDCSLDELYARVSERAGIELRFGLEQAMAVCHAIVDCTDETARRQYVNHLPDSLAELFEGQTRQQRVQHEGVSSGTDTTGGHTLASGRSGSQHPVSEAAAPGAHTQSVARTENPHADSKLSSASGMTQEREQEDLAEGRPSRD